MATRPVIIGRKKKKELIIAIQFSGGNHIRSFTITYRRFCLLILAPFVLLFLILFQIAFQSVTLHSSSMESESISFDSDTDDVSDINSFRSIFSEMVGNTEELLERQRWIQIYFLAADGHDSHLAMGENSSETLLIVKNGEIRSKPAFIPFKYLTRRFDINRYLLDSNRHYGEFYHEQFTPIPYRWPLKTAGLKINSDYGLRINPHYRSVRSLEFHHGVDLKASIGKSVFATARGRVSSVQRKRYGYGKLVIIEHPRGYQTLYAHLSSIYVHRNQFIAAGEKIGATGSSGNATGPHLHYEIRKSKKAINPGKFLSP